MQQLQLKGTLRVSGAGTFAGQLVAPALMEFALLHSELTINMDFNTRMVNFVEDALIWLFVMESWQIQGYLQESY